MTRAARHGNPQSRSPRRSSTNPASVALAVVGVGLLVGFFAILAGTGRRSARLDEPPKEAQPQDMDADLMPRIAALKNFTGAPEEGIRRVDALYAQASRAPAQKELLALRQKFIEAKARKDLDAFRSLKVSLLTSARDGHFAAAYRGIEDFKAAHELVLKGDAGIARLFQEEIATVTQQIEAAREARFAADIKTLQSASDAGELDKANDIYEKMLAYATPAMKERIDAATESLFSAVRREELARLTPQTPQVPRSPAEIGRTASGRSEATRPDTWAGDDDEAPPRGASPPAGEGESWGGPAGRPQEDPDEFFAGGGAGERKALYTRVTVDRDGSAFATVEKVKAGLSLAAGATVLMDTSMNPKKLVESLSPGAALLLFGEAATFNLQMDPTGGRRMRNVELAVVGDGLPDAVDWQDPKHPEYAWHKGEFIGATPQPIFRFNSLPHTLAGASRFVVKRRTLTLADLPKGTFNVYLEGDVKGLKTDHATFSARKLIVIPADNVLRLQAYRALLEQ